MSKEHNNSFIHRILKRESSKSFVKNVSIVFVNNLLSLIKGIAVSLALPIVLSMEGYADYKLFTLYSSYIGLLHFGLIDGICLRYAGKTIKEIGGQKIRMFSHLLMKMDLFNSVVILILSQMLLPRDARWLGWAIAVDVNLHNMMSFNSLLMQITMQFKKYTFIECTFNILQLLSLPLLLLLRRWGVMSGRGYVMLYQCAEILVLVCVMFKMPEIVLGKAQSVSDRKQEVQELLKIGIPLLVSGIVATLVVNLDRQFVSVLFSKRDYAAYSFAYSIMNIALTLLSAMSIVLYPTLKKVGKEQICGYYNKTISGISMLVFFGLTFVSIADMFIRWILPKYVASIEILMLILPALCTISLLQIVVINYYKAIEKMNWYFWLCIGALGLSFLANSVAYHIWRSMDAIAIATVISCCVWFVSCDVTLRLKMKIKGTTIWYVLIMTAVYYGANLFVRVDSTVVSALIYFLCFVVCSLPLIKKLDVFAEVAR